MPVTNNDGLKISPAARIKVIGMGGGGGNVVNAMIKSGFEGVEFIACNTDVQSLNASLAPHKIQLGKQLTRGLGAGSDPDLGRDAALEDRHELSEALAGADMVFLTAGMGGGTGTGGIPVVAQIAREMGALTVGVVTKPFDFEGRRRKKYAEAGIARLRESVDTLITIPNQRLLKIATPDLSISSAFAMVDHVLLNAVKGINDIINIPALINVDFADVKAVMSSMGHALMGIGYGGNGKTAMEAATDAISSPLLEDVDIDGATGILIHIMAGPNIPLMQINEACAIVEEAAHEDANIIFGAVIDDSMGDNLRVTVIATGFPVDEAQQQLEAEAATAIAANLRRPKSNTQIRRPIVPGRSPAPVSSPIRNNANSGDASNPRVDHARTAGEPAFPSARAGTSASNQRETSSLAQLTMDLASSSDESESLLSGKLDLNISPRAGATVKSEDSQKIFGEIDEVMVDSSNSARNLNLQSQNSDAFSISESQPQFESLALADDIDRKIDEALGLKSPNRLTSDDFDMLDVPAFMRNGKETLPLT